MGCSVRCSGDSDRFDCVTAEEKNVDTALGETCQRLQLFIPEWFLIRNRKNFLVMIKMGPLNERLHIIFLKTYFSALGKRSFNRRTATGVTAWLSVRSPLLCPKVGLLFSVTRLVN